MIQDVERPGGPTGEGDRFLSFVEREVIPTIERTHRTTAYRMLAGHSRGGLFVCYSLLVNPHLFDARFAHSPALWRDEAVLVTRIDEFLSARPELDTHLYLSLGSDENEKMMAAFERVRSVLARRAAAGLRWQADVVSGADHVGNGETATPLGFMWLFQGPSPAVGRAAGPSGHP